MIFYVLVITMEMVKQIFVFIAKVLFTSIHPMIQLYSGPNNGETFQHSAFLSTFRHVFTRGQPGDVPLSNCDFDADGKTDFTVWTPSNTIWSWIPSNNFHLIYQYQWGFPYETPFCADFDGDHRTDFGIYRRDTGEWFIMPYNISSFLITFQWGHPTDIPVAGDYDGDGKGNDTQTEINQLRLHFSHQYRQVTLLCGDQELIVHMCGKLFQVECLMLSYVRLGVSKEMMLLVSSHLSSICVVIDHSFF